jgi:hypothetical protein
MFYLYLKCPFSLLEVLLEKVKSLGCPPEGIPAAGFKAGFLMEL